MDEETLRKMAVEQYLEGKDPFSIYSEMGRTKPWFFKWLHRYRGGNPEWYKDKPKTPHGHPRETPPEMKTLVRNIRIELEEHPYAQIGTSAIKWEFRKIGVIPPSDRTINRILKRESLVKKNSLYPQRGGIPVFQGASEYQSHPSGRSPGSQVYQERWPLLFAPCHGSLQPSSLYQSPTKKRRPICGSGIGPLLEDNGPSGLPSNRQRALFPGKQSLSSFLGYRAQALPVDGNRGGLHPYWRTLA